ncbi:uncharacterized protein [Physcomitrium patens]|nr:1,2-dihydroxy-3-keto-5-methylthiopentene dioxygenase-like isoform X1 [Physcomitrium patens]|eukprot:XP_024372627.1 1,2-dihydroxy-3-keto-5-methylthiopentene dioxygenase-like isoform X1 [Physcomitrella patens]
MLPASFEHSRVKQDKLVCYLWSLQSLATMAESTSTPVSESALQTQEPRKSIPIKAWYYNPSDAPPSEPHQYSPNRDVSTDHLQKLGVLTWTQIETDQFENNRFLNKIKTVRGYNYEEVLTVAPEALPNFEENTKKFFMEHLHDHEEIRFILDGVGYEDVRDYDGQWIRIEIKKGDLIVLPPGMYHRFTLDKNQYLKALLLYQGTPTRIQFEKNPETDIMEVRLDYVQSVLELEKHSAPEVQDKVLAATTKAMGAITV